MQHEVNNGWDPICNMTLPIGGPYMYHEITDGRDPICNMRLPMVGTLYVTERYQPY